MVHNIGRITYTSAVGASAVPRLPFKGIRLSLISNVQNTIHWRSLAIRQGCHPRFLPYRDYIRLYPLLSFLVGGGVPSVGLPGACAPLMSSA